LPYPTLFRSRSGRPGLAGGSLPRGTGGRRHAGDAYPQAVGRADIRDRGAGFHRRLQNPDRMGGMMRKGFIIGAALAAALLASPAAAQNIDAEIEALTARVEALEGIRAVKKLQRAFGFYVDRGLWGDAADLFADDGSIELGLDGVYLGRERIEEYLRRLHGGQEGLIYGQLNEWITLQPAITMARDGRSATARWRDQGMLGQYKQHAEWRDGVYENTYEKGADGIWRIKSLHLYVNYV